MASELTPQEILSLPLGVGNTTDAKTVGQYLIRMAGDAFLEPGQPYPFRNKDYEVTLIFALYNAGLIWVQIHANGKIEDYPEEKFRDILANLFHFLFEADFKAIERKLPPPPPKEWYLVCVEKDKGSAAYMTDYFGEAFTEEEAKTKAARENSHYINNPWIAVHIPA